MRIAMLCSNFIRMPPDPLFVPKGCSGAPERIMAEISEALVSRGHDVTLFASGDSQTSGHLVAVTEKSTSLDPQIPSGKHMDYEYMLIAQCLRQANTGAFDIVHSIFDVRSAIFAPFFPVPVVSTLHSPLVGSRYDMLKKLSDTQWYVSISDAQRRPLPDLRYGATIYHGIDVSTFSEGKGDGGYVLVAGRMTEVKGISDAILASKHASVPVYLCGEPTPGDSYWETTILPHIDNTSVIHYGFLERNRLLSYYEKTHALLFPIKWEEPFGLVMIEAMACGTPVIAYNRGSVPEIIKDGVTGFIIDPDDEPRPGKGTWIIKKQGIAGLGEAMGRIGEIDRRACRKHVEEHFTVETMVTGYETLYQKILKERV